MAFSGPQNGNYMGNSSAYSEDFTEMQQVVWHCYQGLIKNSWIGQWCHSGHLIVIKEAIIGI